MFLNYNDPTGFKVSTYIKLILLNYEFRIITLSN